MAAKTTAIIALVLSSLAWRPAAAEFATNELFGMCHDAFVGPLQPAAPAVLEVTPDNTAVIQADNSESRPDGTYLFNGNVEMTQENNYIRAQNLNYNRLLETLSIRNNIYVEREDFAANGSEAQFDLQKQTGTINDTRYRVLNRHARGEAAEIRIFSSKVFELRDATYTTCSEGDEAWRLNARKVRLDYGENVGTANHVWLNFQDVPVFYFPYLTFPVAGRKTGLLIPEFGSSNSLGSYMSVPWYWNIAPNQDATFTLHPTSRRGTQYVGEYRFLTAGSKGMLNGEYVANNTKNENERYYYALQSQGHIGGPWYYDADTKNVSDAQYFNDFGDRFASSLINHIPRSAGISFRQPAFNVAGRAISYKTIDPAIRNADVEPYGLLPQVNFSNAPWSIAGMDYAFNGELSRFYRSCVRADAGAPCVHHVQGDRYRFYQQLGRRWEFPGYFIEPRLFNTSLRYDLENSDPSFPRSPGVDVPGVSLDSGMFFERELSLAGSGYVQTLEPRLYYLYVPYRRQQDLVRDGDGEQRVFDTDTTTLSYENLFLENRFAGGDRIADANQVTLALTSRLLAGESGAELLAGSLGRIYHNHSTDRRVTLPAGAVEHRDLSDVFAKLQWRPVDYYGVGLGVRWDSYFHGLTEGNFQFGYHPMRYNIINLGYRMTRDPASGEIVQQDGDIATVWKVSNRLSAIARRHRSLINDVDKELLLGFEYEDCCWTFRLVRRRYVVHEQLAADGGDSTFTYNDSLMFQVVLKGLTSVGSGIDGLLRNDEYGISGY